MNNILVINGSLSGEVSVSRILVEHAVQSLLEVNPLAEVTYRGLEDMSDPHNTFVAVGAAVGTQVESAAQALPDELISELKAADVVVIGAPIQFHGDGLATAITARLFVKPPESGRNLKGLAPWQLRRVIDHMEASLPQRIELAHLAAMVGLSQAHFSRAFKASTGLAPYHWQLDFRIRRAQELLIDTSASLDQVAEATGFADAVHFGRMFRKLVGATPAVWRHERKS
jgi:AraC-like DNA-binding protein